MIRTGGKEVTLVRIGAKVVGAIYMGATLVWQAVRSCFGAGYWNDDAPWSDDDGWAD